MVEAGKVKLDKDDIKCIKKLIKDAEEEDSDDDDEKEDNEEGSDKKDEPTDDSAE